MSRLSFKAVGMFFYILSDRLIRPGSVAVTASLIILFFLFSSQIIIAQSNIKLTGSVYDAFDRQPLTGATIKIDNSSFETVTDQLGNYQFASMPVGNYTLTVECEGFISLKIYSLEISEDVTTRENLYLTRKVYKVDDVRVTGTAIPLYVESLEIVTREEIFRRSPRDVVDLLDNINGVYVQETGSNTGESRISIRGCDPRHVLILLDGHRINNSSGGQTSLNEIPIESVEKIEVYKGGESARYGGQGLGGVINILTAYRFGEKRLQPQIGTKKGWGEWKTDEVGFTLLNLMPIAGVSSKLVYQKSSSNNDFDYNYTGVSPRPALIRPVVGVRTNDQSERESYFVSSQGRFSPSTRFRFSGQISSSSGGLPGPVGDVDSTAFKDEDKLFFSGQINHRFSDRLKSDWSVGYVQLKQYFNNMANLRVSEKYEDQFRNDRVSARFNLNSAITSSNQMNGGASLERDILYHDNLFRPAFGNGRTVRDNVGVYLSDRQSFLLALIPILRMAVLDMSLRTDFTKTDNNSFQASDTARQSVETTHHYSPKIGFSIISHTARDGRMILRGSYGRSYQQPELNAMFWKGNVRSAGNPNLRPEKSEHSDIGLEIVRTGRFSCSAGITYFHSYIEDIIVWKRSSPLGVWQPVNEKAAQITGHEDFIQVSLFNRLLELNYRNQITNPINKSNGGKILTYRPHYISRYEAAVELGPIRSVYKIRLVDRRYLTEVNSKYDDSYRIDDWVVTVSQKIGSFDFKSTWELNNLRDEEYVLIKRYPMPGRHWSVRVSLAYNLSRD